MKLNKLIFIAGMIILVILIVVNVKMSQLTPQFDKYCTIQYNISDPCPCIDMSYKGITEGFNISKLNLTVATGK